MKKIYLFFCGLALSLSVNAADIVNVDYIHKAIYQQWDISVPFNPELTDKNLAANMKYLLTAVDVANKILNGATWTKYGESDFATTDAADTSATIDAINTLIKPIDWKFFITTTQDTTSFSLKISAQGTFYIDWGDGIIETIKKPDTTLVTYSHPYSTTNTYNIKMGGKATSYSSVSKTAAISFSGNKKLAKIDGSLGQIFPSLSHTSQPKFYQTFNNCTMLAGNIPQNLFDGIYGKPASTMFVGTFANCNKLTGNIPDNLFAALDGNPSYQLFNNTFLNCSGLTGQIPENLFAGIYGTPTEYLFDSTFSGCSGLSGQIPANLFQGISGKPLYGVFYRTFSGCSNLSGPIPENLFSGIYGPPSGSMFYYTFFDCKKLTSIPSNLFGNISGTAKTGMFSGTFSGCTGLVGDSAKINDEFIYNIWPDATDNQIGSMYYNATGLDDYANIPSNWK